jgi:glycogen debranching enzyme
LQKLADILYRKGIENFIDEDNFCVYQDLAGSLHQASSDELHILAYVPPVYRDLLPLKEMERRAEVLYTPAGIACTPELIANTLPDKYHGYAVWPFEQALIHYGSKKFGLTEPAKVAEASAEHIHNGNELVHITPEVLPGGNDRQLWSVAARLYFNDTSDLHHNPWL